MFCSERSDDFSSACCKTGRYLGQDDMYMKRPGGNTGLERTKAECSLPIISKTFLLVGQDPRAGSVLIGLIAWALC